MKRVKWGVLTAIVMMLLLVPLWLMHSSSWFPLRTVSVSGNILPDKQSDLTYMIKPLVKKRNFFNVNLYALERRVEQLSWVDRADVKRVWPQAVVIHVMPKRALAHWNRGVLVDTYGRVFYSNGAAEPIATDLPQFANSHESNAFVMLGMYQQMSRILAPTGQKITILTLDNDHSWQITLNNATKLALGQQKILTRLRHFVKVYPEVMKSTKHRAKSVDLRYKNGMAVSWQGGK